MFQHRGLSSPQAHHGVLQTTTDAREQNNPGLPTLCVGGPVINRVVHIHIHFQGLFQTFIHSRQLGCYLRADLLSTTDWRHSSAASYKQNNEQSKDIAHCLRCRQDYKTKGLRFCCVLHRRLDTSHHGATWHDGLYTPLQSVMNEADHPWACCTGSHHSSSPPHSAVAAVTTNGVALCDITCNPTTCVLKRTQENIVRVTYSFTVYQHYKYFVFKSTATTDR